MTDDIIDPGPADQCWVEPDLPRRWAAMLVRTSGLHWRIVANLAEISPAAMSHLLFGRAGRPVSRVHITTALALINLSPEELGQAAATRVSARRARRILNELHRIGWTDHQLASWLTGSDLELATSRAFYCTRLASARIRACYDYLVSDHAPRALTA